VSLIGTKCCINYNPVLAQRQFGHPIRGASTSYVVEPLLFLYKDGSADEIIPRIRRAWDRKVIMEKDTRPYTTNIEIPYQHWLAERVETVKLPFRLNSPILLEEESEREEESENIRQLKREIEELKGENIRIVKKLKREGKHTRKIQRNLDAANTELSKKNQEIDEAFSIMSKWIGLHDEARRENKEVLKKLHDLKIRINDIEHLVEEWEDKANKEREQRLEEEVNYTAKIVQLEERLEEREWTLGYWKTYFSQLASLANGAIEDVPRMLREADASLMFHTVPKEVESFIEYCKWLVGLMKEMVARSKN